MKDSHLLFVDRISFLLAVQRRPEISHTALCACDEMITHGNLQRLWSVVFDVEGESVFEEAERKFVFTDSVENQTDVALERR